ncbi:MAG: helix-turn-helix transcriptional regulator [Nitrospinae bacterium]|nr:helix-turn-helix transcriptional regulator [Nitrospinota bacterium]
MQSSNVNPSEFPASVGGRLKYWRKVSTLRLVDVAALIRVSQGSLSDLENDKSLPSATTLTGLCQKTDMNICWLLTGEGSMVSKEERLKTESSSVRDLMGWMQDKDFRKTVVKLVNIFEKGSAPQKAQIRGFIAGVEAG